MDEQRASPIHMHKQERVQTPFFAFSLHVLERKLWKGKLTVDTVYEPISKSACTLIKKELSSVKWQSVQLQTPTIHLKQNLIIF